tara:strand:+ start:3337 stop:3795 length:459 start_codon:yes stop_codon:yes gene_type:complete
VLSDQIRRATVSDAIEVANNLRIEDKLEVEGLGHSVLGLPYSVVISNEAVTFSTKTGVICGVAGIVKDGDAGIVWMLCTPDLVAEPITFVRGAKRWLSEQEHKYSYLWNLTSLENKFHHKLLKMLGFKALQVVQPPPFYKPYLEIVKLCVSR